MKYRIRHRTEYSYSEAVDLSYHLLRLSPRVLPYQTVEEAVISADPIPATRDDGVDYFGNGTAYLTLSEPHGQFAVELNATLDVHRAAAPDAATTPPWEAVRDALRNATTPELIEASEFIFDSPLATPTADIAAYAETSFTPGRPVLEAVLDLTSRIFNDFTFDPAATIISTPLAQVMEQRRGVCQDFAHLQVAALRAMGLAARYVSGYIRTYRPDNSSFVGADASHAWVSVFVPEHGWIDFDPTNNILAGDEHITLGWGRDYGDVSPIRGVILGGGQHFLNVAVEVTPLT
jgi:transglutaminase-like putative cysteine protease